MLSEKQLLFRRQFVAGKKPVAVPSDWNVVKFNDLYVHVHPELSVSTATGQRANILILGDIFDPHNIESGNQDIAQNLASSIADYEDFEIKNKPLSGRWVCFVAIGNESRVYPDAGATHTIYYSDDPDDEGFCVSTQPGLLAEYCGIRKDQEIIQKYDEFRWMGWWPGELTPYRRVKKLLANHYLDLKHIKVHRFWPTKNLETIPLEEAAKKIADLTRSTISAIAHRNPVYISLTGGWDSRMIFACSDFENPRIHFLNRRFPLMDYHDISIPQQLVKRANSNLKVLRVNDQDLTDIDILEIYKKNTGYMFWHELSLIHSANIQITDDFVILAGHGGECFRRVIGGAKFQELHNQGKLMPLHYADFSGFGEITYAVDELSRWCASNSPTDSNVYPPVYMDNEYLSGSWGTLICTASNTFNSMLTPFNSLEMFEIGFSVDIEHRMPPYALSREICRAAAPWVLDYPVNTSFRTEVRQQFRKAGRFLPWRVQQFLNKRLIQLSWAKHGLNKHYQYIKDYPPKIADIMSPIK